MSIISDDNHDNDDIAVLLCITFKYCGAKN